MKMLVDMNLSPEWCDYFNAASIKAVHWSTLGDPSAPDEEIFVFARKNGYVIVTHDLDFSVLLARTGKNGPSVVQLRTRDTFPDRVAHAVITAIHRHAQDLTQGAIVTIDLIKARVRILPIV